MRSAEAGWGAGRWLLPAAGAGPAGAGEGRAALRRPFVAVGNAGAGRQRGAGGRQRGVTVPLSCRGGCGEEAAGGRGETGREKQWR